MRHRVGAGVIRREGPGAEASVDGDAGQRAGLLEHSPPFTQGVHRCRSRSHGRRGWCDQKVASCDFVVLLGSGKC